MYPYMMSRAHSMREREREPYAVMCKQGNFFFFFFVTNKLYTKETLIKQKCI